MSASKGLVVTTKVQHLKPVLQELSHLDRYLFMTVETGLKKASAPVVTAIVNAFPDHIPHNMMKRHRLTPNLYKGKIRSTEYPVYSKRSIKSTTKAIVGGRKNSVTGNFPVLRIRIKNGGAMIFDMAQNQQTAGNTLVANLQKYGQASRVAWKTLEKEFHLVQDDVAKEMNRALQIVQDRIGAMGGVSQYQKASARASVQVRGASGRFGTR